MITMTMIGIALTLFLIRVPVSICMGIASLTGFFMLGIPVAVVPARMIGGVNSFALLAVPFFILAGNLMNAGGVTERIFAFARSLVGWVSGGLAQVNIVASIIFAGMSGSALADLAGLGAVEIRAMRKNGYPLPFSAAITLSSCTIGPLIPPSIILVIYGLTTNTSIGRLFLGGVFAGLVVAAALMIFVFVYVRATKAEWAKPEKFEFREVVRTGIYGLPALFAPVVILGSLILGVTTPSELGAIATLYALFVGLIYRQFTWRKLKAALINTVTMTAVIMYLFAIAGIMNFVITRERVAHHASEFMAQYVSSPFIGILLINGFLILVGMFLEGPIAILVIAPILLEVVADFGMGPVQFGIMLSFNLLIGMITPPVGIGLFVGAKVAGITPEALLKAVIPFFIPLFAGLALISYVPAVTEWLPAMLMGAR